MDLQAYQDFLVEYSDSYGLPDSISEQTVRLGLMGETGEVIEWLKKQLRDGSTDIAALKAELGDVLVSFFLILKEVGIPLSEVDVEYIYSTLPLGILFCASGLYGTIDTFLTDTSTQHARAVLFAIKRIAALYDIAFDDIVEYNWDKLSRRLLEGKQRGSGDNR